MRKRFGFITFLIIGLTGTVVPLLSDSRVSEIYLDHAAALYEQGDADTAMQLLETALEFRPNSSDALYLQGLIKESHQNSLTDALGSARRAFQADAWARYSDVDGGLLLARLLFKTTQYEASLEVLASLRKEKTRRPEYFLLRTSSLSGMGDRGAALREVTKALLVFPEEPKLAGLFFSLKKQASPDDSLVLRRLDRRHKDYPEALLSFAEATASEAEKESAGLEYFQAGGTDPLASCILLESGSRDAQKEMDRFLQLGGLSRMDLLRRLLAAGTGKMIEDALADYSGTSYLDANHDGIPEEKFQFSNGKVHSWERDENQDGKSNLQVTFDRGLPAEAVLLTGDSGLDGYLTVQYGEYPHVTHAVFRKGLESREYSFITGRWSLPVLGDEIRGEAFSYRVNKKELFSAMEGMKDAAYEISIRLQDHQKFRRYFLSDGSIAEVNEGEIIGDVLKVSRKIFLSGNVPVWGEKDIDGDGVMDVREIFANGKLQYVEYAGKNSAAPLYREFPVPKGLKEWDLNQDGRIDIREYQTGKSSVQRNYSSLLDGIFDAVTVETRNLLIPMVPENEVD